MIRLQPTVVNDVGQELRLIQHYQTIEKTMQEDPRVKAEVMGDTVVDRTPWGYYKLAVMKEWGITFDQWDTMSINDKGKYMAYMRLQGMVNVSNAYRRFVKQERKRMEREIEKQMKNAK